MTPISKSAPHIYLSALPFAPEHSLVAKKFSSRFPNTLTVAEGRPAQWPFTIFTAEHDNCSVRYLVFSPDEKTFAFISDEKIYICESETGHLISGPLQLRHHLSPRHDVSFSFNGTYILVGDDDSAVIWDIKRGEEQFEIEGSGFVFIYHGHWRGSIASINRIGESKPPTWMLSTQIAVKLWDVENGTPKSSRLFKVMDAGVTRFSPDGRFLAVERKSEEVIELWNLEDCRNTQQFPHAAGHLSLLCFSLTSDILMASFQEPKRICVWRLDAQNIVLFSGYIEGIPTAVICAPLTTHLFIRRHHAVEIWEVSMTGSHMISKTKLPSSTMSICPSRDGHRILVGGWDGIVRMWDMNLARNQPVTQDETNLPYIIAIPHSRKVVATKSKQSVEFRDTTTWEVVGCMDTESRVKVAFSSDENQVAVLSNSLITLWDINNPENRLSFDPWPTGRRHRVFNWKVAFQTNDHVIICTEPQMDYFRFGT